MTAEQASDRASTRPFWLGVAVGVPILAFGVRGMFVNTRDAHPAELLRWIGGAAVVHDALVLPVVLLVAVTGRRFVPGWAWPALRWALMVSGIVLVVSRPFVAGWGYNPRNPTALDRNYGLGVAVALLVVWLLAAAWAVLDRRRLS